MTGTWDLPEMRRVIDQVQQIWEAKYKDLSVPDESRSQDSQNRTQRKKGKQKKNDNIESIFDGIRNELAGLKLGAEDDFLPFVGAPPVELHNLTPVQWWGLDGQRSQYPRLHRMALDILSVPPMSDAPERTFFGGRRTISWTRARLKPKKVEMVETMANWISKGLIPPDTGMKKLLEEFTESCSDSDVDSSSSDEEDA